MARLRNAQSPVRRVAYAAIASAMLTALSLVPSMTAGASLPVMPDALAGTAHTLHPQAATGQITAHNGKFWLGGQVIRLKGFNFTGVTNADLQRTAGWGANVVRLRVHWSYLEQIKPQLVGGVWQHTYDQTALSTILSDVSMASQNGQYTIIDNHPCTPDDTTCCPPFSYPSWLYTAPYNSHGVTYTADEAGILQAQADYWTDPLRQQFQTAEEVYLAQQLVGKPGVLGYEIQNEPQPGNLPHTHDTTQMMLNVMLSTAKAVRAVDPTRVVLFSTRAGYGPGLQLADLSGWRSLAGNPVGNVAFDLHDYFGARWGDGIVENPGNPDYGEGTSILFDNVGGTAGPYIGTVYNHTRFIQQALTRLTDIPIFIGEFGDDAADPGVYAYYGTVTSAITQIGVSWAGVYGGTLGVTYADDTLTPYAYIVINAMKAA
jgi:hypothetical protein